MCFKRDFIPVMAKLNFQQLLRQSSVSHDPSETILTYQFGAQETFLIIINVQNNFAAYYCGNRNTFF